MSLELYIEDHAIPIGDDFKISLVFINPLFSEKKINEAYSFSFSLPASPALNNVLKNSKRVDSNSRESILNARIKKSGVLMVSGKIRVQKTSRNQYSGNIYNDGRDVYKICSEKKLSDYDYGTIELWKDWEDSSLSYSDKLTLWSSHFGKVNDEDPNTGAYKFPMIKAYYDAPEEEESKVKNDGLNYVFWKGGGVNIGFWQPETPSLEGKGQKNTIVPRIEFPNDNNWVNTYSPCLRIEHMLKTIIKEIDLDINTNELEEIQEYLRLTNFSNYVCDHLWENATNYVNVHGRKYELKDFTPDASAWTLFEMLIELFSVVFIIGSDGTMDIVLSKTILEEDAVDFSSKTNPETVINKTEGGKDISIYYDVDKDDLKIINDELLGGWSLENADKWMYKGIGEREEHGTAIQHMPLRTLLNRPKYYHNKLNFYSIWNEYTTKCSGVHDNIYLSFAFMKLRGAFGLDGNWLNKKEQLMLSSRIFPEQNDKPERFNLLLFHGRKTSKGYYTTINPDNSCVIEAPGGPFFDVGVYLTCNLDKTDDYNINGHDSNHPNISVSTKHIYLNDNPNEPNKGTFSNYKKQLAEFEKNTEEINKTLYLDPHEVHELSKFRNAKHRINSPEGGFEGIVKKFKVQLTNNAISPTSVTYLKQIYED